MAKNILISAAISTITLSAVAVFAVTLLQAVDGPQLSLPHSVAARLSPLAHAASSSPSSYQSLASETKVPGDYPSRLLIPSISVDAHVQYVGVTSSGDLGTPDNFTDVAWYDDGVVPGGLGSALIDGHVDNGLGLAGVFKNLAKVKIGDTVSVATNDGTKLDFKVVSAAYYNYKEVPINDLFNENDEHIIRLITCGGSWVSAERTYDERLVVTAVQE